MERDSEGEHGTKGTVVGVSPVYVNRVEQTDTHLKITRLKINERLVIYLEKQTPLYISHVI